MFNILTQEENERIEEIKENMQWMREDAAGELLEMIEKLVAYPSEIGDTYEMPGCLCEKCRNRGGKGCTREDMKEIHHKGRKYLLSMPVFEHAEEMRKLLKHALAYWCDNGGNLCELIVETDALLGIIKKEESE